MHLWIFFFVASITQNIALSQKTPPPWRAALDGYVPFPGGPRLFDGGLMVGDRTDRESLWTTRSLNSALDAELAAIGFRVTPIDRGQLAEKIPKNRACLPNALQFLAPHKDRFLDRFQDRKVLGTNPHKVQILQVTARLTAHYADNGAATKESAALETGVLVKVPTPSAYLDQYPRTQVGAKAAREAFKSDFMEVVAEFRKKRPEAVYEGNGPWYRTYEGMWGWLSENRLVFDANPVWTQANQNPESCVTGDILVGASFCASLSTKNNQCNLTAKEMTLHHPLWDQFDREYGLFGEIMASEAMQIKIKSAQNSLETKRKGDAEQKQKEIDAEKKKREEERKRQDELRERKRKLEELGTVPEGATIDRPI